MSQVQCKECGWYNHGHSPNCSRRAVGNRWLEDAEYRAGYNAYGAGEAFQAGASREWAEGYEQALADSLQ